MSKNQTIAEPTILGIDPGTRHLGVAVLKDASLLYYGVKTFKKDEQGCPAFAELKKAIVNLTIEYQVDRVALEKVVSVQQLRSPVGIVSRHIKTLAEERRCLWREYSPAFVRSSIGGEKVGREKTWQIIAQKYPELNRYLIVQNVWQKNYFAHLFDAVAVALLAAREFEEARHFSSASNA